MPSHMQLLGQLYVCLGGALSRLTPDVVAMFENWKKSHLKALNLEITYFCSMRKKALAWDFSGSFYTLWAVIVLFSLLLLSKSDLGLANVIISMLILKAERRVVLFPKLLCQVRCEQHRHYCSILRLTLRLCKSFAMLPFGFDSFSAKFPEWYVKWDEGREDGE